MRNAEIEGAATVAQPGPACPPFARGIKFLNAARPRHHHGAKMGDRVDLAILSRQQEQGAGTRHILLAAEAAHQHEAKIEARRRQAGFGRLMVIGAGSSEVLVDPPTVMEHRSEIVGCGRMTGIRRLTHRLGRLYKRLAPLTASEQGLSVFVDGVPLIHGCTLIHVFNLTRQETQFRHKLSICARFQGCGMTQAR